MSPSLHVFINHKPALEEEPQKVDYAFEDEPDRRWAWREFLLRTNLKTVFSDLLFSKQKADCFVQYGGEADSSQAGFYLPDHEYNDHRFRKWEIDTEKFLKDWKTLSRFEDKKNFLLHENGKEFCHDIIGICFGILDRWEEVTNDKRDAHKRFPAEESILFKTGVLNRPVVDEIANCFGRIVCESMSIEFINPKSYLALTWDIDSAGFWYRPSMASNVRRIITQKGISSVPKLLISAMASLKDSESDPHLRYNYILENLRPSSSKCTWFVQVKKRHKVDNYDLISSKRLLANLSKIETESNEIELHSSYNTYFNKLMGGMLLDVQMQELGELIKQEYYEKSEGTRAHYLKIAGRRLATGSLKFYDASLGFSGSEGFRLGTAWPVRYENLISPSGNKNSWARRYIIPFHFMDVTMRFHKGLSPEESLEIMKDLNQKVEKTGGIFSIIWHPNNLDPFLWSGWEHLPFALLNDKPSKTYRELLKYYK